MGNKTKKISNHISAGAGTLTSPLNDHQAEIKRLQHINDLILSSVGEGIFGLDTDGNVFFINESALRIFGFSREEVLGKNMHRLTHYKSPDGEDNPVSACPIYQTYKNAKATITEQEWFVKKDETIFPVQFSCTPIEEKGEILGAVVSFVDRTNRLAREKALQESEEKNRSIVTALHEGIILQSADRSLQTINESALDMLGLTMDQINGKHPINPDWYLIKEDGSRLLPEENPIDITFTSGNSVSDIVLGIHHPDGLMTWVNINCQPIKDAEGNVKSVVTSFSDITHSRQSQSLLRDLNRELERSNRELQDFASVASHDLQEPLRKIQAFSNRVLMKYQEAIPEEGKDYLNRMNNAALRMQTLINDLLTFSRVTTKAQPFHIVNLNTIAREVLIDLEISIEDVQAEIKLDKLPSIYADPTQMRQLFQNLIGNAVKFHAKDRKPIITIHSSLIKSDNSKDNELYQITIEDNGIGFDEKYVDRIFNVFQRLHTTEEFQGNGVGLAVCRKIVERHNGTITAHSHLGKGTTFIITLPSKQPTDSFRTDKRKKYVIDKEQLHIENYQSKEVSTYS